MDDPVAAIAEQIINYIKNEDVEGVVRYLNTGDPNSNRRTELRYEFDLIRTMDAIFEWDILIPKLIMCDVQTISPFHYAALRGMDAILERFILQHEIPVDMTVQNGTTALHFACFAGMLDTVSLLKERFHSDINRRDRYGWTPLHYASIEGQLPIIKYLVSHGADISVRDKDGTTAAYRANSFGHVEVVSFFVQSSGDDDMLLVGDTGNDDDNDDDGQVTYAEVKKTKRGTKDLDNGAKMVESDYEVPAMFQEKAAVKEDARQKVADIMRTVLNDDPYCNNTDSSSLSNEKIPVGIGMKTLTRVLKEEFDRFKNEQEITKALNPNDQYSKIGVGDSGDYEDITRFSKLPSKSTNIPTEKKEDDDDDYMPIPGFSPPPLPPRSSAIIREEDADKKEPVEMRKKKVDSRNSKNQHALKRTSYMTLRAKSRDMENSDKSKALLILARIDYSSSIMEACFDVLVKNIGDVENWKKLCYALPLRNKPEAVKKCIRNIEMRYPANPRKQALDALQDWRNYFGESANVQTLMTALRECCMSDVAHLVERAADEFTA